MLFVLYMQWCCCCCVITVRFVQKEKQEKRKGKRIQFNASNLKLHSLSAFSISIIPSNWEKNIKKHW